MSTRRHPCDADALHAYAIEALPAAEAAAVEAHLQQCETCRQELAGLTGVVGKFKHWPREVEDAPAGGWDALAARIGVDAATTPVIERWKEPDWEEAAPGIWCKLLATDAERSRVSMLVRLAPLVDYPPHRHAGVEELHLLEGELWIDDRKLFPGDYNRAEPGTADQRVWSETGCTCILITSPADVLG